MKVDHNHCCLQPKPAVGAKPRTILGRIHHFQKKERILRRSTLQLMEYKGNKVLIFPDYTSDVMTQRWAFRDMMQALQDGGIKHTLRYPARLYVYQTDGAAPVIFNSPKEATLFLKKGHIPEKE